MKNDNELRIVEGGNDPQPAAPTKPATNKNPKSVSKPKPSKILPSDRVIPEKQFDILRAYAAASGPGSKAVNVNEVAKIADVAASTVTMLNPFFCDSGLLQRTEKGGVLIPSQEVISFANAYGWNRETAAYKLAPLFANTWFADTLMRRLSFQPMKESEAIQTLAELAGVNPSYANQLRVLLAFLQFAGLISIENGTVKASRQSTASPGAGAEHESPPTPQAKETPQPKSASISTAYSQAPQGVINFHVDVKINMDEFAHWSPDRISSLFSGIAQVLAAKGAIEKEASKEN